MTFHPYADESLQGIDEYNLGVQHGMVVGAAIIAWAIAVDRMDQTRRMREAIERTSRDNAVLFARLARADTLHCPFGVSWCTEDNLCGRCDAIMPLT